MHLAHLLAAVLVKNAAALRSGNQDVKVLLGGKETRPPEDANAAPGYYPASNITSDVNRPGPVADPLTATMGDDRRCKLFANPSITGLKAPQQVAAFDKNTATLSLPNDMSAYGRMFQYPMPPPLPKPEMDGNAVEAPRLSFRRETPPKGPFTHIKNR
jgi:hypothetical protein